MKKQFLCAAALIISSAGLAPVSVSAQEPWDGSIDTEWEGSGTADSPYLIGTAAELAGLAKRTNADETFEGKFFKLTADIRMSDPAVPDDQKPVWTPIASHSISNDDQETNPGGWYGKEHWFKGTFDGAGHTIHDLWFSGTTNFDDFDDPFGDGQIDFTAFNIALFGGLDGATIRNLNVKGVNIGGAIVAGLAIEAHNTTFTDLYIDGHVKSGNIKDGGSAAGLVSEAYSCRFVRCESNVNVYSYSNPACLVGQLKAASTVEDCSAGGTATGCVFVGGLVSSATAWAEGNDDSVPTIRNSRSSALVTIIPGRNQGNDGGGFIGLNYGYIYNCCATGNVHVTTDSGAGFCSENRGHIESCYATGDVYNEEYGVSLSAFVTYNGLNAGYGEYYPGTILNCYATGKLEAPEAPSDVIATPTHINGFVSIDFVNAGARMANCYYDSTKNPDLYGDTELYQNGAYGVSTEEMQSKEFVDSLNMMAAVMGTALWQYNAGAYPTPTDTKATNVQPLFGGGDGTEANPFIIADKEHLKNLAYAANRNWNFSGQYLKQTADIALNAPMESWGSEMPTPWKPIAAYVGEGHSNTNIPHFCGVYDGGMHTVSNMYIDDSNAVYQGLFGVLGKGAEIKNLGVVDAWVNALEYSGILAGATRIHNDSDQYMGASSISHCWTSGQIESSTSSSDLGGIVGYCPYGGDFNMYACYSTAEVKGKGLVGDCVTDETFFNGSWFGGKAIGQTEPLAYSMHFFFTFYDITKNPVSESNSTFYKLGRTTEYMQSRRFVNDLNYAAAAKGVEGGWLYNEGAYPSFTTGEQPSVTVTLVDGMGNPIDFKVFAGSTISRPESPAVEGKVLSGWYTDEAMTNLFEFGKTVIDANTTLYARWSENIAPDYSVFQNKFTKTYTIITPAQLYGFANIVNGTAEGIEKSDFADKTVELGADIVLNETADFDSWGISVTPTNFVPVGGRDGNAFNGTFDGKGHTIDGIYIEQTGGGRLGFFGQVGANATISNVIVKHAYIVMNNTAYTGLLAGELNGIITQCGAEGKIVSTYGSADWYIGGLAGHSNSNSKVSECYAAADIETINNVVGGLVGYAQGTTENCYATGSVKFSQYGRFGGITAMTEKPFANCYSAVALSWNVPQNVLVGYVGGSYGWGVSTPASSIYDRDLVSAAFEMLVKPEDAFNRGRGLTTAEMKTIAAYEGWNFETLWGRRNDQNDGYPYLRWTAPGLENDSDPVITIPVHSVVLDRTSIEGKPGDTVQLTATVAPENATDKTVTWTSSNPEVAMVDESGLVTLVADGKATVTVASAEKAEVSAVCEVTVETPVVEVAYISLSPRRVSGEVGETVQLTATVLPENATDKTIAWNTSDAEIATVDDNGLVTITGVGSAEVTVTATNGVSATCRVTGNPVEVAEVRLDRYDISGEVGETVRLNATVLPENATDKTLTWSVIAGSSMNGDVAMVDQNGLVTIVGEGSAQIVARANNGVEAICMVSGLSGIENVAVDDDDNVEIFTLQGMRIYIGRYGDACLTSGMYIMVRGMDVMKIKID